MHTIKGTTGFLGFKRLEKLAHAGESLLGLLRDGKITAGATLITALLHLLDGLRELLKTIEAKDNEGDGDDSALIARLEELQTPAQNAKAKNAVAAHPAREVDAAKAGIATAEPQPAAAVPIHTPAAPPHPIPAPTHIETQAQQGWEPLQKARCAWTWPC